MYNKHYGTMGQAKVVKLVERSTQNMYVAHNPELAKRIPGSSNAALINIKGTLDVLSAFSNGEFNTKEKGTTL